MNDIEKTFQHLIAGLDDKELELFSSVIYREQETRIRANIIAGRYPLPLAAEVDIWKENKLKAIQTYRDRIKNFDGIRVAKCLFESVLRS